MKFATKAVHTGVSKDTDFQSVITPIYPSSNFYFTDLRTHSGYDYTRSGNPTRRALEENIAALEGGCDCRCTATGMAAITAVLHLLRPGDHVVCGNDIYGGTYRLMADVFSRMDIAFSFVDMRDLDAVRAAWRDETAMVWIETPSNPLLNIVDIAAVARLAQERGAISVADNTFLSPYFQRPFAFGVDIVVHSTTKYINGHSDVVGGAVVCRTEEHAERIAYLVNALGVGEAPFDAWLVLRGVKTLALRMECHAANALAMARHLDAHPLVAHTYYPGLPTHPQHDLAKRQMTGFGGMVTFDAAPSIDLDTFFASLHHFVLAESLGGVESLIEAPWYMSHASMDETARRAAGIHPHTIRVSVGIEDARDLIADIDQALAAAAK